MSNINMHRVVELVREQGVDAHVENTGGNVATIYAGPERQDEHGDPRHAALAGPGAILDDRAVADSAELCVGPDDDGDAEPTIAAQVGAYTDEAVADLILREVEVVALEAAGIDDWFVLDPGPGTTHVPFADGTVFLADCDGARPGPHCRGYIVGVIVVDEATVGEIVVHESDNRAAAIAALVATALRLREVSNAVAVMDMWATRDDAVSVGHDPNDTPVIFPDADPERDEHGQPHHGDLPVTVDPAVTNLLQLVDEATAKGNDWPGLPAGHVALAQQHVVDAAVAAGLVQIVGRPAKVDPQRVAWFIVRTAQGA